ncbi:MAG TPA: class I adenylate-forming enzyme family protein [Acidimicrobiia bacterium]|nr:class I adenylate-forming enzyme family protein [Acidimicrobiia bacterium]
MSEALRALLAGDDSDVAVVAGDRSVTRGELRELARSIGDALRARPVAGTAIGVVLPNDERAIATWFAAWDAGAAFVPLNPRAPTPELQRLVDDVGTLHLVTTVEHADAFDGVVDAIRDTDLVVVARPGSARAVGADDAIVQLTSGTTGPPKAVPLRAATITDLLDTVIGSLRSGRTSGARMPNLVPLSLATWGGIYQVLFAFRLGVPVVVMARFDPHEFARLVARHEIRSSVLPPAALVALTRDPTITTLAPLRYVRSVAAPLSPAHARAFHERFGVAVLNGYGQTEIGGEVIGWTAADWKEWGATKLGAIGRPHAGIGVRVRRDDGLLAASDESGELELRGRSALDADDPALAGRVTDDGWLRSGDLGRIDPAGFVWIEGRVSSMINRGGLKVFPDEVEEVLRSGAGVADVAVVGVPDDRLGEVPWAFVVADDVSFDGDDLLAQARARLAAYKVPAGWTLVGELPRNEMGKVLRHELVPLATPDAGAPTIS